MVIVDIHTTLKDEELPEKFEETVSKKLSDLMDYPLEVYYCIVKTGDRIWHDGNRDPFVYVNVITANRFNDETNPKYANDMMQFFRDYMKLPINSTGSIPLLVDYQSPTVSSAQLSVVRVLVQLHECPLSGFGYHRTASHYTAEKYFRDGTIQH